jgi:hypothetical protein
MKKRERADFPMIKFSKLIIQKGISSRKTNVKNAALSALAEIFKVCQRKEFFSMISKEIKQKNFRSSIVGIQALKGLL